MTGTTTFNAQLEIAKLKEDNKTLFNTIILLLHKQAYDDKNTDSEIHRLMLERIKQT